MNKRFTQNTRAVDFNLRQFENFNNVSLLHSNLLKCHLLNFALVSENISYIYIYRYVYAIEMFLPFLSTHKARLLQTLLTILSSVEWL